MNLEERLKQNRYNATVIDKDYFKKRTEEMFEEAIANIEFEKRWNAKHGKK